jgi:4-carboxymuconolactone decarboxylase
MATERFQRALEKMMEYQSKDNPDISSHTKLIEYYKDQAPDLPNLIVEFPFGDIYSRPALDKHQQALVTIAGLTTLAAEPQLELHINTGFNVGLTKDEVVGAIIDLIPYIGFPRCLNALTIVKKVLAERDDVS